MRGEMGWFLGLGGTRLDAWGEPGSGGEMIAWAVGLRYLTAKVAFAQYVMRFF